MADPRHGVAAAVVVGVAIIGFLAGTGARQDAPALRRVLPDAGAVVAGEIEVSPRYGDRRLATVTPGGPWRPKPPPGAGPDTPAKPAARFPHRVHGEAAELACKDCHRTASKKAEAGMPRPAQCDLCHEDLDATKPADRRAAVFFRGKEVVASGLTRLGAHMVFSHETHVGDSRLACATCHGELANSDAVTAEHRVQMSACVDCHGRRAVELGRAPDDCARCHDDFGGRAGAVADWSSIRAFEGAPPSIPHPVRPSGAPSCRACHLHGLAVGPLRPGVPGHEGLVACEQCHLPAVTPLPGATEAVVPTTFVGLAPPPRSVRSAATAPPDLPHPTFMRERCLACHGPTGRAALQTPHPGRVDCLQCHLAREDQASSR